METVKSALESALNSSPANNAPESAPATQQSIDPWDVKAATDEQGNTLEFDYEAISKQWDTKLIDTALLERFERLTGHPPHRWLRRGLFFSHRDFDLILDRYEHGEPFFLYTGRGPSSDALHLGHTIPFTFTKWLQDIFDVPLVIMLTDDEKALFKPKLTLEDTHAFALQNAKDIIACGFDLKKTFIFSDLEYVSGDFLMNVWEFSRLINFNQVRGTFGFDQSTSVGRLFFPAVQCAAAFATSYPDIWSDTPAKERTKAIGKIPCIIPCAIDQDPYFRLLRDNSHRMRYSAPKPALIHSKFLTALQGPGGKMSGSIPTSAIFMTDTPNQIKNKINKHAFSGGRESVEEHRKYGGRPEVDVAFHYLSYFEDSDELLAKVEQDYRSGEFLTGDLKKMAITKLQAYVGEFQSMRAKVTDELMRNFMTPRRLIWGGNPNPKERIKEKPRGPGASKTEAEEKSKNGKDKAISQEGITERMEKKIAGVVL